MNYLKGTDDIKKEIDKAAALAMIDIKSMDAAQLEKELAELIRYAQAVIKYSDKESHLISKYSFDMELREDVVNDGRLSIENTNSEGYIEVPSVMKSDKVD